MIYDPTPRWKKILDALSQLGNVALLPDHKHTTSDESISGRSHRMGWHLAKLIDVLFLPFERDHCARSYRSDVGRAKRLICHDRARRKGKKCAGR